MHVLDYFSLENICKYNKGDINMKTYPTICASVAGNPSPLGVKMHNAGYEALGLDYTYVAMGTESIHEAINIFKSLGFKGMGVSMPFKQSIIDLLDEVHESVRIIGACNTVVEDNGKLIGYNTDWIGAQDAINEVDDIANYNKAVIIGAGGVARAIAYALKVNGIEVYISARNEKQRKELVSSLDLSGDCTIEDQGLVNADIVVNATPDASNNGPVQLDQHKNVKLVFDVIFNQYMTDLTNDAKNRGLKYVSGWRMLLLQGAKQFELYTSEKPPVNAMGQVLLDWLNK